VIDNEFPKKGSRGSGSEPCYSVEARYTYPEPKLISGVIYHKEWKRVPFEQAKVGVPSGVHSSAVIDKNLLSYKAAQALRWWFHAGLGYDDICFETRIVKHVITHSYSEEIVSASDYVGGQNKSSNRDEPDSLARTDK
jgi:hypothetical protein